MADTSIPINIIDQHNKTFQIIVGADELVEVRFVEAHLPDCAQLPATLCITPPLASEAASNCGALPLHCLMYSLAGACYQI